MWMQQSVGQSFFLQKNSFFLYFHHIYIYICAQKVDNHQPNKPVVVQKGFRGVEKETEEGRKNAKQRQGC